MKNFIDFYKKHRHRVNKYQVAVIVFLIITFSVGDNIFLDWIHYKNKVIALQKDIELLKIDNEEKLLQLKSLQGDRESLEQFAREQFLMSKPNEELFLIVE